MARRYAAYRLQYPVGVAPLSDQALAKRVAKVRRKPHPALLHESVVATQQDCVLAQAPSDRTHQDLCSG